MNLLLLEPADLQPDGTARMTGRRLRHALEVLRAAAGDVLRSIDYARRRRLTNVYLGYRVEGCPSLQYKGRFQPQERLRGRVESGHAPRWDPEIR